VQIVGAALATGAVGVACAVFLHGLWNTIDWVAWKLHRIASTGREMHRRRSEVMSEKWVRALEAD
jgi:hypothetical protein